MAPFGGAYLSSPIKKRRLIVVCPSVRRPSVSPFGGGDILQPIRSDGNRLRRRRRLVNFLVLLPQSPLTHASAAVDRQSTPTRKTVHAIARISVHSALSTTSLITLY